MVYAEGPHMQCCLSIMTMTHMERLPRTKHDLIPTPGQLPWSRVCPGGICDISGHAYSCEHSQLRLDC